MAFLAASSKSILRARLLARAEDNTQPLPIATEISEKHGSGCVLSAALASNFAKQLPLEDACRLAKHYTERYLNSNQTLLGTHNYNNL